jgi:methionyl-tRNA formyltransferase
MLEAEDKVDCGRIFRKAFIRVPKHALWDEINHLLFTSEVEMMNYAIQNYGLVAPQPQVDSEDATYFRKRSPLDSQIDPNKSIAEQFDLMRVCDPNRFPAYFEHLGQRYILKMEKSNEQ